MLNIIGLPNLSNTCYLNSTLQTLNNCKYFHKFMDKYSNELDFKHIFQETNETKRLILYKDYISNIVIYVYYEL